MKELQIPKNWKWESIEDALDFVIGGDWGKDESFADPDYGLAYCIRGSEIKNWDIEKGKTASSRKIKLSNIEKRKLREGDILVEISGGGPEQPVGRTVLIDKTVLAYQPQVPKICTNFLRLIRPKEFVDGKYLNFFLKLFYASGEIVKYQGGSNNLRNLKFPDFIKVKFPLPPKPTQIAIVSKIEELFSELDNGIEDLRLAQEQLKVYRQSVLKWAFEGRLTNKEIHENTLPKGWSLVKIEHATISLDNRRKPINKEERKKRQGNIPYYGANGQVGWIDDYLFDEPLVCVVEDETFTGRQIPFSYKIIGKTWVNNHAHVLKPKEDLHIDFLNYQLSYYPFLELTTGTTGRKKLTKGALSTAPIKVCSLQEQIKIVQEIENRLSVTDKIQEDINMCLQQAQGLRQSILKKAFEGQLTNVEQLSKNMFETKGITLERKVLAGKIIHFMNEGTYFGLTKFQKVLYLVENFAQVDYDTNFIKERAGPYDREFTQTFRKEMVVNDWFREEQKRSITKFVPGANVGSLIVNYAKYFRSRSEKIVFVIQLLQDKSTHEAELIATLYAVWNNRLITKKPIRPKDLVIDFFNWSPKKKEEFQEEEIEAEYKWMKKVGLVPIGFGKCIELK